jgi:phospholipase C
MSAPPTRANALDHIVVVLFENRSLDNVLGRLYEPADGKTFEGVGGKDLSNPIPDWAEHGADRKVVPYTVATDMDSPNPDSGEEWYYTNTQLCGTLNDHNRFSEVPSQTFMNRSFWTAATSSGLAVNSPVKKWFTENDAETIFERLEHHGKTWKVCIQEPMPLSFTGVIHYSRLKDRLATHWVPIAPSNG